MNPLSVLPLAAIAIWAGLYTWLRLGERRATRWARETDGEES